MNKIYCGIDIGKKGAIVALFPSGKISLDAMPQIGTEIDCNKIAEMLIKIVDEANCLFEIELLVGMEDVHSIYGASAKSNFQFGRALGIIEGIVASYKIPFLKFSPKKWQKELFEGIPKMSKVGQTTASGNPKLDTKGMAAIAASRLYPSLDLRKSSRHKNVHDGIVDALLIAHYIKLKY